MTSSTNRMTTADAKVELVKRLRELASFNRVHYSRTAQQDFYALGDEAADEIERLRSALEAPHGMTEAGAYYYVSGVVVTTASPAYFQIMEETSGKQECIASVPFNKAINPAAPGGRDGARRDAEMIVRALNNSVAMQAARPIDQQELGEANVRDNRKAHAGRSGPHGDASGRHTGPLECRGTGAGRDDQSTLRSGGAARATVVSSGTASNSDRQSELGSAETPEPGPIAPVQDDER